MNDGGQPGDGAWEIAAADSLYQGFPDFSSWSKSTIRIALWEQTLGTLTSERVAASPEDLRSALDVAMRAAAIDTGAIEGLYDVDRGFTMTVATQTTAWQAQLEERGDRVPRLFQAQLAAYELVLDAATAGLPISETWVRRLHEEVCRFQETYRVQTPLGIQEQQLPRGQYKTQPNHVRLSDGSIHPYAPVHATAPEMKRLIDNISTEEFDQAHPVLQTSYVHYALVVIHPFADGNGRVARAVASTYFYRAASVPLLVFADQRARYLGALEMADAGNPQPFIDFISQRGLSAMTLITESLKTAKVPSPESTLQRLRGALISQAGLTHQELDQVANRLLASIADQFTTQISSLDLPVGVAGRSTLFDGSPLAEQPGFRRIVNQPTYVEVVFDSQPPAEGAIVTTYSVLVSRSRDESEVLRLARVDGQESLAFGLHDIYPDESAATTIRLGNFVRRQIAQLIADLFAAAQSSLRSAGYTE